MLLKIIAGNAIVLGVGYLLFLLYDFAGIPFALGAIFGTFLWHIAYGLHTGDWT